MLVGVVTILVMRRLIMTVGGGRCDSDHDQLPTERARDGSAVTLNTTNIATLTTTPGQ